MIIGSKLYRIASTADSMGWARSMLNEAPDGAIFLADAYTHVRGRQGRTWEFMPGQLLVTLVLKPPLLKIIHQDDMAIRLNQLNMAICLGILDPLKKYGAGLKWPNDVVIGGKKIAGMLMQLVWQHDAPQGVIVGFAINVNNIFTPEHHLHARATSLAATTGSQHDLRALYKELLLALDGWYSQWSQLAYGTIYKMWRQEQACLGTLITVHHKDGAALSGLAKQVMPNGDLLLLDEQQKQHTISFYQVEEVQTTLP